MKNGNVDNAKGATQRIFGTNSLQIGDDEVSRLVGGIVEKGFSNEAGSKTFVPLSKPQPTVLPFPVARHRSHGPHWNPKPRDLDTCVDNDDDSEDDGEDEDLESFHSFASLAQPIHRKKKKPLDFSCWRGLATYENPPASQRKYKNISSLKSTSKQEYKISEASESAVGIMRNAFTDNGNKSLGCSMVDAKINDAAMEDANPEMLKIVQKGERVSSDMIIYGEDCNLQNRSTETFEVLMKRNERSNKELKFNELDKYMPMTNIRPISNNIGGENGGLSLQSEIDAENRTQLDNMSAEEIAEAQAEIMEKMRPELIEVLKKRGLKKLNQKQDSSLVMRKNEIDSLQGEKNLANESTPMIAFPKNTTIVGSEGIERENTDKDLPKLSSSGGLWDSWSKRVESVREVRFSLDGDVVKRRFVGIPKTGNLSAQSDYSASNVTERDFLRTEGDPGAVGYTFKEAMALARSVVPGQRAFALHLVAAVLSKALHNIVESPVGCTLNYCDTNTSVDWVAVWAFALGPESSIAFSLRTSLDDNHYSVILACAKAIQCALSCEINESFFDISEKVAIFPGLYTAPVFRNRPDIDVGFLHGGFWKYNTKSSNIFLAEDDQQDKPESERTIQDDITVAEQDIGAGLVRMAILPRICYLLEANPSTTLEESIISILIAIARHSPTCAGAIMKFQRLLQTLVNKFTMADQMEITTSKIRYVSLFKVLARSDKKNCLDFIKNGIFQKMIWHLYQHALFPDHYLKLEKDKFKLSSALVVEQLRFWKVCIEYGHCVSYFFDLCPALFIWLDIPTFEKLIEKDILAEFVAITNEAYLVVEALTRRLPNFYSHIHQNNLKEEVASDGDKTWQWSHVGVMVDLALKWIAMRNSPYLSVVFSVSITGKESPFSLNSSLCSILWVISSVVRMLSSVLERVIPEDIVSLHGGLVPWLPDIVPKIGLEIIRNGLISFSPLNDEEYGKDPIGGSSSFMAYLCHLRCLNACEVSIASVCCLQGILQLVVSVDKLIQIANPDIPYPSSQLESCSREDKVLTAGIIKSSTIELEKVQTIFAELVATEPHQQQTIEIFGRGGPAPGIGVGWGSSGGGFWSTTTLLSQIDARLFVNLVEIFQSASKEGVPAVNHVNYMQRLNSSLVLCLLAGPRDKIVFDKVLNILLKVPVMKYLSYCIHHFLHLNHILKVIEWEYKEEDYLLFCNVLASHFRNRWLCQKKLKSKIDSTTAKTSHVTLDTINEDLEESNNTSLEDNPESFTLEWAHQRFPLPKHWFLSPISTIKCSSVSSGSKIPYCVSASGNFLEVCRGGLFFTLGLEALSNLLSSESQSSVHAVPVVWKLHSLSVVLLVGMGILEDDKSRDVYGTLQAVYGQFLDKLMENEIVQKVDILKFQSDIHESYSTFVETLIEQFAAVSYGDLMFGRQVAIYLHRCVEVPIRLAAWSALSNARVLELLPPLDKCIAKAEGYILPVEEDERILEAYVKSWTSGALDRAATRGSISYGLVMYHLSSFVFGNASFNNISLRNKLVKSLLRDYSSKKHHEAMMIKFIQCKSVFESRMQHANVFAPEMCELEERFKILNEACDGNSSLLAEVAKLEYFLRK